MKVASFVKIGPFKNINEWHTQICQQQGDLTSLATCFENFSKVHSSTGHEGPERK